MTTSMSPAWQAAAARPYRRCIGWIGTTALAMGGSNQSLFLIAALFAGQGDIPGQGSAAVPLLALGLLLGYAALPGWIELVMMSPHRVGGIAAACTEAFKPYGRILSPLVATCYWWGWVPTCGLTAILSATAIHEWYLPGVPIGVLACGLLAVFTALNLRGIETVTRLAIPIATCSAALALVSGLAPVLSGATDWQRAVDFKLTTPFAGWFGGLTSLMAGLYLVGFAAPAFEAAACHAGETKQPERNVPRAMKASAALASIYFVALPIVWLGTLGARPLGGDLGQVLGPTFAPLFGALAKPAALWFMMFNMFHGTIQPLAGAARTLSQIADDGFAPRWLSVRNRRDVPVYATLATAGVAIVFLLIGDPIWLVAAANFTYLIGIAAPSIAVWLLRRNAPDAPRPYRAPRHMIGLGVAAAVVWLMATVLGFEQFGLPTVVFGLAMAYSGAVVYAWRCWEDRRRAGLPGLASTLHLQLTGAMLAVLALDGAGYILAVSRLPSDQIALRTALEDIFVVVALLTITVGIVLPGMIAHAAEEIGAAARQLATGTLRDFSRAMGALGRGDLDAAHAKIDIRRVQVNARNELGEMAVSFDALQKEVASAALGLDDAREGLRSARERLTVANRSLQQRVAEQLQLTGELIATKNSAEIANAAKNQFMARMSHELRTPLNGVLGPADLLLERAHDAGERALLKVIRESGVALRSVIEQILDIAQIEAGVLTINRRPVAPLALIRRTSDPFRGDAHGKGLAFTVLCEGDDQLVWSDPERLAQIVASLLSNAVKFTACGAVELRATLRPPVGATVDLHLSVRDSGRGIAAGEHEGVFASFAQADESRTRDSDGAGVGLFLVRELVRRLDGVLSLDSAPGRGSHFTVTLPLAMYDGFDAGHDVTGFPSGATARGEADLAETAASPDEVGPAWSEPVTPPMILLAEDNPTNRAVALAMLSRLGLHAQVASDGEQAVQLYERGYFDLVLMDCHMPGMDGLAAAAAIRTMERARGMPHVPIVAITADLTSANLVQCRSVGIDDVIAKPITFAEFAVSIREHLPLPTRDTQPPVSPLYDGTPSALVSRDPTAPIDCLAQAVIDEPSIAALFELTDDDTPDLAHDIIATYLANAGSQVAALVDVLQRGELHEAAKIAHTLKSSSAYVGALGFAALMTDIERRAESGTVDARQLARQIVGVYVLVRGKLTALLVEGNVDG
ncbi:ATP-binding protein [Burkholderia gladioli]|uniref:ATP-binding protein n=1 Tax=Burkholderia gladioli TaxID=28095 RepID=UPI002654B997|nr:ATP-binding protein [Burkholderia gladioli]MDN7917832.1 amino acid permease [Burkholderia gladioli]